VADAAEVATRLRVNPSTVPFVGFCRRAGCMRRSGSAHVGWFGVSGARAADRLGGSRTQSRPAMREPNGFARRCPDDRLIVLILAGGGGEGVGVIRAWRFSNGEARPTRDWKAALECERSSPYGPGSPLVLVGLLTP